MQQLYSISYVVLGWGARQGVIMECPLTVLFINPRDIIMMFWTDVFKVVNVDDDAEPKLGSQK